MGKKLFREIREGENKEEYLEEIKKICKIDKGRRHYGHGTKYFAQLVWNIYHPDDPKLKGDGFHVHHIDENKLNDDISNLEKLTKSEHIRLHMKGKKSTFLGKHHSEEARKKISEHQKGEKHHYYGKHLSEEHRRRIGEAQKGEKNHMFGKHLSEETIRKRSEKRKISTTANFIEYGSVKEAAKNLSMSTSGVRYRIKAKKPGYFYTNKTNKFEGVKSE